MKKAIKKIGKKIGAAIRNPRLVIDRLSKKDYTWSPGDAVRSKSYATYEEYTAHQRSKLPTIRHRLDEYDAQYRTALADRLRTAGVVQRSMNALCLAARIGTEVKAFIDLGCFAIGIDLNPGKNNQYVVTGDFHHVQYADQSVDIVFSNSIDHAFDLELFFGEVNRVLKPSGYLILEVAKGEQEGASSGYYESIAWDSVDAFLQRIAQYGFTPMSRSDFEYPWLGEHITFTKQR